MKAVIRHALAVYNVLNDSSKLEDIGQEKSARIFRGKITDVFRSTGIGQSYYTSVFNQLETQGCITILQRGARSVESVIVLHRPPTVEGYVAESKSALTDAERYANLRDDVEALKTLVGGIHIGEALKEVEQRLRIVEESITAKDSVTSNDIVQS
jgi:hypothetical protein